MIRMRCGVLAALPVLAGGALSIDAVVSEAEATFDARLLGASEQVPGSDRAVIERARPTSSRCRPPALPELTVPARVGPNRA